MLTQREIAKYHSDGYVTPDFHLPQDVIEEIRLAHDRLVARYPQFTDYCSALLAYDTWYLTIARRADILDMVSQILGDNIALWNSSFFAKPAKVGSKTPWHQDGEYWPISPLATCTVWIAIDAATAENGCLKVIPGSHRSKQLAQHNVNNSDGLALNLELDADEIDESTAADIVLQPGQISLHDVYLYHGSDANNSNQPRRGMTLRYMPTSSVYQHDASRHNDKDKQLGMSQRTVYLMRGVDTSKQNDFRVRF